MSLLYRLSNNKLTPYLIFNDEQYRLLLPEHPASLIIISPHICYLLQSANPRYTYFGYTNNLEHRLRQHNGIIKGGAKYTSKYRPWKVVCYVSGFPDRRTALQFEWRLHHPFKKYRNLAGKIHILADVLALDLWSSFVLTVNWVESYQLPFISPNCRQQYV